MELAPKVGVTHCAQLAKLFAAHEAPTRFVHQRDSGVETSSKQKRLTEIRAGTSQNAVPEFFLA